MINSELSHRLDEDFTVTSSVSTAIFDGPRGVGKLSSALAIARRLTAGNDENILLYTARNIIVMLTDAYDNFMKNMDKESTAYFLKAVDTAFLRLASSDEKNKVDKSKKDEILLAIENIRLMEKYDDSLSKDVTKIYKLLSGFKYSQTISVDDVRYANQFLHSTNAFSASKVLIMENLEEQNRAVSNALLKLLEEPPRDSLIIILSLNSSLLLKTITSRARVYHFTSDAGEYVAKSKEREDIKNTAALFAKSLALRNYNPQLVDALNSSLKAGDLSQKEKGKFFIDCVAENLKKYYQNSSVDAAYCRFVLSKLKSTRVDIAVYNQSALNALEGLLLSVL